jgi:tRNA(Ile)-lysidine synthetase-like protein
MAAWRNIRRDIESTSNRYLVCVSGGVDSIFLLDFLFRCEVYIEIAHFNHNIRQDSDQDEELVVNLAKSKNCVVWTGESLSLNSDSNELDARTQRWNFIEQVARDRGFTHIITAHHADDQVENVLIRLMRGDPHSGLIMNKLTQVNKLIRYKPLLSVTKAEIVEQSQKRGLTWHEDSTNICEDYDRNFVRRSLLPMMATRTNIYQSILTGVEKTQKLHG